MSEHDTQSAFMQYVKLDEDVRMAEDVWRAVVKRWRNGSAGEGNWSEETK